MKNLIATIIVVTGISILFSRVSSNIWSFWLGFILCVIGELFIIVAYCFIKVQKAYRDSFTIKLTESTQSSR